MTAVNKEWFVGLEKEEILNRLQEESDKAITAMKNKDIEKAINIKNDIILNGMLPPLIQWIVDEKAFFYMGNKETYNRLEQFQREAWDIVHDTENKVYDAWKEWQEKNPCPKCGLNELLEEGANALSRRDNETEICDECANEEAFEDEGLI